MPKPRSRAARRAAQRERARRRPAVRERLGRIVPAPLRSRRLWAAVAVLAVVAVGAWAAVRLRPERFGPPPPPASPAPIAAFRVLYDVTDNAGQTTVRNTEAIVVRRPWDSRTEQRPGPPPGGEISTGSVTNREYFWFLKERGEPNYAFRRSPGGPQRNFSYPAYVDAARRGLVDRGSDDRILGRPCTHFFVKEPYPAVLAKPSSQDRVDACISPDGVMLSEEWTLSGKLVRTTVATEFAQAGSPGDLFFEGAPPPDNEASKLIVEQQQVTEDDVPLDKPLRPLLPPGFTLGRKASTRTGGAGRLPSLVYAEAYVRGGEIVVVEQGTSAEGSPPWTTDEGRRVDAGKVGPARILYYPDHVEVRVTGRPNFVRVQAPSEALALYFARTLRIR